MLDIVVEKEIQKHLAPYPGAAEFIVAYGNLCHGVDDLIDQDVKGMDYKIHTLDCFGLAADVYSCRFYQQNVLWLYPIVKNIHRVYAESVLWEKSGEDWKKTVADVLRCGGNEVILAILEHLCHLPYADLRRIGLVIREDSWQRHHTEEGKPT